MRTRRLLMVLTVAVLGAALASCEWPERTRYVDEVFDDVQVVADIPYRTATAWDGSTVELLLDIYLPAGDAATERPVLLWQFGGAWVRGDRKQLAVYAEDAASRGYVGVTIEYRTRPEEVIGQPGQLLAAFHDAFDDGVAAVAWLRDNAATYGLDPDVIVSGGVSAGAVNSLALGYYPPTRGPAASPVQGVISISGTFEPPVARYDGVRPPVLAHHGDADDVVPFDSAQRTCDLIEANASPCVFHRYDGGGHYIVVTDHEVILERSALFVFEHVLLPHGYVVEIVPA